MILFLKKDDEELERGDAESAQGGFE